MVQAIENRDCRDAIPIIMMIITRRAPSEKDNQKRKARKNRSTKLTLFEGPRWTEVITSQRIWPICSDSDDDCMLPCNISFTQLLKFKMPPLKK